MEGSVGVSTTRSIFGEKRIGGCKNWGSKANRFKRKDSRDGADRVGHWNRRRVAICLSGPSAAAVSRNPFAVWKISLLRRWC